MRALAWLLGVCLVLTGLFLGLMAVVGYFTQPNSLAISIGIGVVAFVVLCLGSSAIDWSKRVGETTLRAFDQLRIGATLDECVTALGAHGRQMTSSTELRDGKEVERKQCFWTNANGSYCEIILENGHVVSKNQLGLN